MSVLRKQWQDFKKKYPDFEKSKNFKADAGPLMDELYKKSEVCIKLAERIEANVAALEARRKKLDGAFDQYEKIVDALAQASREARGMKPDFKYFRETVEDGSQGFENDIKRLAKGAQQYEVPDGEW